MAAVFVTVFIILAALCIYLIIYCIHVGTLMDTVEMRLWQLQPDAVEGTDPDRNRIHFPSLRRVRKLFLELEYALSAREERMNREHEQQLQLERMRFAQLQDQINPHFLYNTLENIRAQAIIDDNETIADMTELLSRYFRYNISRGKDIVTLGQEIDNIRTYMQIQQYRFRDRFEFTIRNDDESGEVLSCPIPKMTLQPIVENAIFHGVEKKTENGHIQIRIGNMEHYVEVLVIDDGVGMDAATLQKLQGQLKDVEQTGRWTEREKGHGIALPNVGNRLRILYGDQYGLSVSSMEGVGTEVQLILPKTGEENG